jgi:hypothetical protein
MPLDQTDPDAPASALAKAEISKGLALPDRKRMTVSFSGPGAPHNLTIEADPAISWKTIADNLFIAVQRDVDESPAPRP